jgi:hypothetical protein
MGRGVSKIFPQGAEQVDEACFFLFLKQQQQQQQKSRKCQP